MTITGISAANCLSWQEGKTQKQGRMCERTLTQTNYVLDAFIFCPIEFGMTDGASQLRPASAEEIATALSFALRYDGRKRVHDAADAMARITAERLVRHLQQSGFVIMKAPAAAAPTTTNMPPSMG